MNTRQRIEESIVEICRELETLRGQNSDEANDRRTVLLEQLHLIGATAAFFGGYGAMKKLHDAAEEKVGNTNEIGDRLNRAWDLIGGWLA